MRRMSFVAALTLVAAVLVVVGRPFQGRLDAQQKGKPKFNTWRQYLGSSDSSQYSSLDQINRKNVGQIQVAWTYSSFGKTVFMNAVALSANDFSAKMP